MTGETPKVVPLPADWPGRPLDVMPGDFSRYVPHGMGLAAPMVIRPWDDPVAALSRPNYYGFDALDPDPVRAAPTSYPEGGVIYFDDNCGIENIEAAMMVIGVRQRESDYIVIARSSDEPMRDRYLDQVRIMSRGAAASLFRCNSRELTAVPQPSVPIEGYIRQFIAEQDAKWGYHALAGTAGGDGDWAKERLSFGFMVENGHWGVYRMWSRPWLITK